MKYTLVITFFVVLCLCPIAWGDAEARLINGNEYTRCDHTSNIMSIENGVWVERRYPVWRRMGTYPAGDGCNTCTTMYFCTEYEDHYSCSEGTTTCTLLYCAPAPVLIPKEGK